MDSLINCVRLRLVHISFNLSDTGISQFRLKSPKIRVSEIESLAINWANLSKAEGSAEGGLYTPSILMESLDPIFIFKARDSMQDVLAVRSTVAGYCDFT